MLENLKVDIIYYRITKDFEMEFNLCGCCRMRLLNSVADDIKSLINSLKLAVARSKIILLCGEINGEKNLFDIISKAICRETEEVDNSVYGISSPGTTRLMKNSIPLITKSGNLCGCVVEEGPQSIIILSDNKEDRKEIMNSLIHQYITELSAIQRIDISNNSESGENIVYTQEDTTEEVSPKQSETDFGENETENLNQNKIDDFITPNEESSTNQTNDEVTETLIDSNLLCGYDKDYSHDLNLDYDANDFPLVDTYDHSVQSGKPRSHSKHSKPSTTSPLLAILICLLLCFIGILAYFLILKPLQTGISISDNLFRLFPFLSRRFL